VAVYELLIAPSAVKELDGLPRQKERRSVAARIRGLAADPRPPGSIKLSGEVDLYRVRQGPYRVLYEVDDRAHTVLVLRIAHRKDAYR
jgi:mRNA interferase RelE/StbE